MHLCFDAFWGGAGTSFLPFVSSWRTQPVDGACVPWGRQIVLEVSHLKMHADNDCYCHPMCKAASWSPVLSALALEPGCAPESQVAALPSLHFRFFPSCGLTFPVPLLSRHESHFPCSPSTLCPASRPGINTNPPKASLSLSPQPDCHLTINWKTYAFELLPGDWAGMNTLTGVSGSTDEFR